MSNVAANSGGISVLGLLGVAFVVLKLTGVIGWSWWWVTAPFWGPLALFLSIVSVALLIAMIVGVVKALTAKK